MPAISGTHNYRVAKELALLRMYCVLCACSTANPELSAASDVCIRCKRSDNGVAPHTRKLQPTPLPINGKNYSFFLPTSGFRAVGDSILFFSHSAGARARVEPRRSSQTLNVGRRRTYHPSHTNNRKRRGFYTGSSYLQCTTATCGYMNTSITWCTSARHMGHRVISGRRAHSAHMQRCPHGTNAASFSRSVHTTHKRWSFLDISSRCAFLAFARRASI